MMQYSFINLLSKKIIIDNQEGKILNTFLKTKELPVLHEFYDEPIVKSVVYGAVLHNESVETINHGQWLGYLFAYPFSGGYNLLSITDIYLLPTMVTEGLTFTPFAALVESNFELDITPEKGGVSAFLRFEDMDVVTNVLNRECIYAMKEIDCSKKFQEAFNWKSLIDDAHLLKVALAVK